MKNYEKYKDFVIDCIKDDVCNLAEKAYGDDECSDRSCSECREFVAEWLDEEYTPKTDWSKVPVDTPVICTNHNMEKHHRHFSRVDENGSLYAFRNGKTSWTANDKDDSPWCEVELAREEDVEKYSI